MKHATTQFDFSAKPKVTALKPKYRQRDEDKLEGSNLMNDPRIVRGNTYAAIIANRNEIQPPPAPKKTLLEGQRKTYKKKINFDTGFEPITPRALSGRSHFTTQTEPFVETLRDKPIQYQKQCQTDLFLDRPVERLFNPMEGKIGIDRSTQIEENDPELFNFDYEVQPILDALLNKIVETSRMELFEEQELKIKQKQKMEYEKKRHAKLVEAQKLEANEIRLKEENERRELQYKKEKQQECFLEKKVINRIISKHYLKNLKENNSIILEYEGFFRSPLEIDLFQHFIPWLYGEIKNELQFQRSFSKISQEMVIEAEDQILGKTHGHVEREKFRRQSILQEKRERKQSMRILREEAKRRLAEEAQKRQQGIEDDSQKSQKSEKSVQSVKNDED